MRALFDLMTRAALRFRVITIAIVIIVMVLGGIAATELNQELLPPIEFPQTFVLAPVSGMTADQALNVITSRLEQAILEIPDVVNVDSQTSSQFIFLVVSNNFGIDQDELRDEIQAAIDTVYFPTRTISGDSTALLGDMTADVLIYMADRDPNLLFQLSADVWQRLPDATIEQLLAYLAQTSVATTSNKTALERLVEQEVVPRLEEVDTIVNVSISGGQSLPSPDGVDTELPEATEVTEVQRLILQLSPEIWAVVAPRLGFPETVDESVIETLSAVEITVPTTPPSLPESWQTQGFSNASDLLETRSLTSTVAATFNDFLETGVIKGAIQQTDDLTADAVQQMLAIDVSLATAFEAEQLAALAPEIFAELPADLEFDGFTRDALAATQLARILTDDVVLPDPVNLPSAWRIQPPQIITFSFADLPLATFSVFSSIDPEALPDADTTPASDETVDATEQDTGQADTTAETVDYPEGPALPVIFSLIGDMGGFEMDTADDALELSLPPEMAGLLGGNDAAALLNLLPNLGDLMEQFAGMETTGGDASTDASTENPMANINPLQITTAMFECGITLQDLGIEDLGALGASDAAGADMLANINFDALAADLIGCIDADVVSYVAANDPDFLNRLSPAVYGYFNPEILAIEGVSPTLGDAWASLAERPEFSSVPLRNADDVLALGNGSAATTLNTINEQIPASFAGYEIRLFDELQPVTVSYFASQEADFYSNLSSDVLLKFSPTTLAALPEDVVAALDADVAGQVSAIANGDSPSAAQQIAEQYITDAIPARDDAPPLNDEWEFVANFLSIELNNAYDFFRFPDVIETPASWINGIYNSPQGSALVPDMLGNTSAEAVTYILNEDPEFLNELEPGVLLQFAEDVYEQFPESVRERAESTEIFVPDNVVTRLNGAPSLLVTVFKDVEANTVRSYHEVAEIIAEINANNENIEVDVAFEQSSFVEESISGVVREGTLGAFFAIINILIFLSGGIWGRKERAITGVAIVSIFGAFFAFLLASATPAWSLEAIFADEEAVLFAVIAIAGVVTGIGLIVFPGRVAFPSWRSTLVIAVSIPLSIFAALMLMRWFPPALNALLAPVADNAIAAFMLKLAPDNLTLNIMTLSGLTVAVGRLVDDSIVVLENIFKQMQVDPHADKREVVLMATRDVSVAIFSATAIGVIVFLPLGLTGGIIAEFFLPFGLAVTYTLFASFIVAITVIPALAFTFISAEHIPDDEETWMERLYIPILKWALGTRLSRTIVILITIGSVGLSGYLLSNRPAAFLPDFGEPQLSISVTLPAGTGIVATNELVEQMETAIAEVIPPEDLSTVQTTIGGGGMSFDSLIGGGGVSENIANITVAVNHSDELEQYSEELEARALVIFGEDNFDVSAGTLSSGGFGGFELVLSSTDDSVSQATLESFNEEIVAVLEELPDLENVTSNLTGADDENAPITYVRVNGRSALTYTGVLLTDDTINFTAEAIEAIETQVELPEGVKIGQGFDSELQTEGFSSIIVAMGIGFVIIIVILMILFKSPTYWLAVIGSVMVMPVGASIALTITDRVLGISALIGILMLLGLVVTNAIVLIDRVTSNRFERNMNLYDALVEGGARRLRPILMTALTTIIGLVPLSLGLSEGAIIAAELGTVVIGGVISSTMLTLIVVPVAYYLLTPLHNLLTFSGNRDNDTSTEASK